MDELVRGPAKNLRRPARPKRRHNTAPIPCADLPEVREQLRFDPLQPSINCISQVIEPSMKEVLAASQHL